MVVDTIIQKTWSWHTEKRTQKVFEEKVREASNVNNGSADIYWYTAEMEWQGTSVREIFGKRVHDWKGGWGPD